MAPKTKNGSELWKREWQVLKAKCLGVEKSVDSSRKLTQKHLQRVGEKKERNAA